MNDSNSSDVILRLSAVPGIGPKKLSKLLSHLDMDDLDQLDSERLGKYGFNSRQIQAYLVGCLELEKARRWQQASCNHHIVTLADSTYPMRLKQIVAPPPVLFVVGSVDCLCQLQIAIVGSRQAGVVAKQQVSHIAAQLAECGIVITSGLALGIDGAAHQGALEKGRTIAVMGTGCDRIYPARHRHLAQQISEAGALVSEFFPGTAANAQHFPRRNRVISALSVGVVVSEAALKSGSLITAHYALEQNRELFAIPGNIDNPLTEGPHRLIQDGAKLITSAADILEEVIPISPDILDKTALPSDNSCQQQLPTGGLLDNVGYETTSIDQIVERSLLPVEQVVGELIELEMSGFIAVVPGGYVRLRRNP
ncbi:DNA-processing protein DprA [Celerinatantimonas diazotrophica]|uniref:DNA processing protein n=1 Tax=Celerinatantimonas diazotrophica TaxID=412034 RepID=A0A4R1J798_9GAMM|nr:DNA-processing protein DprA [Celerinatantimonas diazotrophica]TCK46309.1 DNA processing protein [Celerinatantimonas diazotrophica]CAG9295317.1 hypothetical protein CEDIAZO_00429 [Celerinatantimonas diazotrophica]